MHPLDYVPVFVWMFLGCLILIIFCFGYNRRDDVVFRFAMDYDVCLRLYRQYHSNINHLTREDLRELSREDIIEMDDSVCDMHISIQVD